MNIISIFNARASTFDLSLMHRWLAKGSVDQLELPGAETPVLPMPKHVGSIRLNQPARGCRPMFLSPFLWCLVGFAGTVVFGSFFEWTLHRFVLHRPLRFFRYPFDTHAMVHHKIFRADHTYHVQYKTDQAKIPMAWWNGPVLILAGCLPFTAMAALTSWCLLLGAFVAACTYYATYEYLHWCMHKPKHRVVERSGIFFLLNGHHLLHNRYMNKNFNVVLPLADLCLGTLIVRSKVCFAQARGEGLPDVQPNAAAPVE